MPSETAVRIRLTGLRNRFISQKPRASEGARLRMKTCHEVMSKRARKAANAEERMTHSAKRAEIFPAKEKRTGLIVSTSRAGIQGPGASDGALSPWAALQDDPQP